MKKATKATIGLAAMAFAALASADPITPEMQAKVDKYKHKIVEWAADPALVAAVKEANAKGPIPGMGNGKWDDLGEKDPAVVGIENSATGQLARKWQDKSVGKINVWDAKGNVIGSNTKPLLYNAFTRPAFVGAAKGHPWQTPEAKPDPATQKKSVNISAPVMDGGKVIGVVNAAVEVQ